MLSPTLYRRALPAGARIGRWRAPDGWSIRRFDWPADVPSRGSILFLGGRGDMLEKYLESIAHWHDRGWDVSSFDWRGQGGSGRLTDDPHVGHVEDFALWIDDLKAFWAQWCAANPGPHVLMGHSMGGHLILRAMIEGAVRPDAAVLVAPMLGLKTKWGARFGERFARMLGNSGDSARSAWKAGEIPGARVRRQALLTHDRERYGDETWWQSAKPELVLGPPSWRWVMQAFASTRAVREGALKTMRVPTLMLVADADMLVSARAAIAIAQKLPDVRLVRFGPESAHEILREADAVRDRALGEIDTFLAARATQS